MYFELEETKRHDQNYATVSYVNYGVLILQLMIILLEIRIDTRVSNSSDTTRIIITLKDFYFN
jgi:hypothetical protein